MDGRIIINKLRYMVLLSSDVSRTILLMSLSDKGSKMTADIMKVNLQKRYPDDYSIPLVTKIKSYVCQLINNKRASEIIDFYYHISIRGGGDVNHCIEISMMMNERNFSARSS